MDLSQGPVVLNGSALPDDPLQQIQTGFSYIQELGLTVERMELNSDSYRELVRVMGAHQRWALDIVEDPRVLESSNIVASLFGTQVVLNPMASDNVLTFLSGTGVGRAGWRRVELHVRWR